MILFAVYKVTQIAVTIAAFAIVAAVLSIAVAVNWLFSELQSTDAERMAFAKPQKQFSS